uniref:Legume lectin domain-containing protein n=1 Tax=Nelumbo nucifera TaxID=4432 RepID=A0A822YCZ0_NELNU|nr:TPA_asm: hypothetical protein HUJ06_031461 [Nelumbo nucifera]
MHSQFLGLFNITNINNPDNHIVAIELDTIRNPEFSDINDNHIGIDFNGLISSLSAPVAYFLEPSECGLHRLFEQF